MDMFDPDVITRPKADHAGWSSPYESIAVHGYAAGVAAAVP
jgi:hypothetical protein